MLAPVARLRRARDFSETMRGGLRISRPSMIVYLRGSSSSEPARVGFTVSGAVGGSVVRHRVTRVLRAGTKQILPELPAGARIVVRALPGVASLPGPHLQRELQGAVREGLGRLRRR